MKLEVEKINNDDRTIYIQVRKRKVKVINRTELQPAKENGKCKK